MGCGAERGEVVVGVGGGGGKGGGGKTKDNDVATKPTLFGHLSERAGRDGM